MSEPRDPNELRELLGAYPVTDVQVVDVRDGSFGGRVVDLEIPGEGTVPFELGKKDLEDLVAALQLLGIGS